MRVSRQRVLFAILGSVLVAYSFGRLQAVFKNYGTQESVNATDLDDHVPSSRFRLLTYFQKAELNKHHFGDDGLLVVNPNGSHPIYELIKEANIQWRRKVRRASTTLGAAVKEYKRRYHRAPPQGFNFWYGCVAVVNQQLLISNRLQVAVR
jgi:hypothetical protein